MRRIALSLVTLLVTGLVLAACGGDSAPTKAEYKKEFQPINEQIKTIGSSIGDAVLNAKSKSDAQLAEQFKGLSGQANTVAGDLDNVVPPDDAAIKKDQAALVAALNQGSRDLTSISEAAAGGNTKAAAVAVAKLAADSDDIQKPRQRIETALATS